LSSEWSGDWCHLMIPMQYEHRRHCVTVLGWQDPRGLDFSSGRLQQMPVPDKGGIFQRDWWQVWEDADNKFPPCDHIVVSIDGAFTEKEENDPTACTVWGCFEREGEISKIILMSAWRKWLPFHGPVIMKEPNETVEAFRWRTQKYWGLLEWIEYTADRFHAHTVLIEAKGPGISAAQALQSRFGIKPWGVIAAPVKGDKVARAFAAQPTFAQGLVYAPIRDWSQLVIDELANFPKGKWDDLTDSTTQAINWLRTAGRAPSGEEWEVNREREGRGVGRGHPPSIRAEEDRWMLSLTVPETQSCLCVLAEKCLPRRCGHLCWCCYDGPAMTHNWRMVSPRAFRLRGSGFHKTLPAAFQGHRITTG